MARFRLEATVAAGLDHPHIVTVYDSGEIDGRHYFSMKYVEGGSLADLVRASGPLAAWSVAKLPAVVAAAVHFAHQRGGALHRDLKPGQHPAGHQRAGHYQRRPDAGGWAAGAAGGRLQTGQAARGSRRG